MQVTFSVEFSVGYCWLAVFSGCWSALWSLGSGALLWLDLSQHLRFSLSASRLFASGIQMPSLTIKKNCDCSTSCLLLSLKPDQITQRPLEPFLEGGSRDGKTGWKSHEQSIFRR